MSKKLQNQLFGAARAAYDNAHAPYSKFPVGAAVLAGSGKIYNGCNVENASSPEGLCAEASAIAAMVAAGEREIVQICVVCKSGSWARLAAVAARKYANLAMLIPRFWCAVLTGGKNNFYWATYYQIPLALIIWRQPHERTKTS